MSTPPDDRPARAGGVVRPARRPDGWQAPGPSPAGDQGRPELRPADDEDLCFLCGDWRLFQKVRGHRWSLDDLVTAWVATRDLDQGARDATRRALDLGCGLGSVLLMVAWTLPHAEVVGIEAQADRAAMGRRAIAYNGCADRCRIHDGDLRDDHRALGAFDLITGTPPYFPPGTGTTSQHTHAEACRFEVRGGVEDYLAAAARHLAPGGAFTVCTAALERSRLPPAAAAVGLTLAQHVDVVPRDGKDVLVCVDRYVRAADAGAHTPATETLIVRERDGAWTPRFREVRAAFGMPTKAPPRQADA